MPACRFEHFTLEFDADANAVLKSTAAQFAGEIKDIRAHRQTRQLTVEYRGIRGIEVAMGGDEFRGKQLHQKTYGVSFRPDVRILNSNGDLLLPKDPHGTALTRVTYWHIDEADLLSLAFMRNKADRQLFIQGCKDPELLLCMATANATGDNHLSSAAYERALELQEKHPAHDAETKARFIEYIAAETQKGNRALAERAIADYRRVDRTGEAALSLATLMHELGRDRAQISSVLDEAVPRLIKRKPRKFSLRLGAILDFVMAEKLATPSPVQLLWQAYLAASAEREVTLLRKIFLQAKVLKADRETLEMIYKTWRGFQRSDPGNERQKKITAPKWLSAPNAALEDETTR